MVFEGVRAKLCLCDIGLKNCCWQIFRSSSQDRGRRSKRGSSGGGGSVSKRGRVSLTSKESAKENRDSGASSPESLSSDATVPKRSRTMKQEIKEQKE